MILTENLQPISPQEAKDRSLFGPVYHGSTSDKLEKITTQGFKIAVGNERSGDISNGYQMSNYSNGIPAPIHHLGFGVYFTTVKEIAKRFSYGNTNIGPYFLDTPRLKTINFGSPNTMMKWWSENGYDYRKTAETTYGNPQTNLESIRQERMRATLHMTEYLRERYDSIWFKGKGIKRLLDGDQVCVYDSSKIYKVNKDLIKPGEIGSKIIAKVNIDPWGKGIEVPIGTNGIIVDKKKPDERQEWAKGSEWLYSIKWEKGRTMWGVLDSWIEPYIKSKSEKLNESFFTSFTTSNTMNPTYVEIFKNPTNRELSEILKEGNGRFAALLSEKDSYIWNRDKALHYAIQEQLKKEGVDSSKLLPVIIYLQGASADIFITDAAKRTIWQGKSDAKNVIENNPLIRGKKILDISYWDQDIVGKWDSSENRIKESDENMNKIHRRDFWKIYEDVYKMNEGYGEYHEISKLEEQQTIDYIKKSWKTDEISKTLKKIKHDKKFKHADGDYYDLIDYSATWGGLPILFMIRKNNWGVSYKTINKETGKLLTSFERIIPSEQQLNESVHYLPISKIEEQQVVNYIKKVWAKNLPEINVGYSLKKVKQDRKQDLGQNYKYDAIDYRIDSDGWSVIFHIRKTEKGVGFFTGDKLNYSRNDWVTVVSPSQQLNENEELYFPTSKEEEDRVIDFIKKKWRPEFRDQLGKTLKKIKHLKKYHVYSTKLFHDLIEYTATINNKLYIFSIVKFNEAGLCFQVRDDRSRIIGKEKWNCVISSTQSLNEALGKRYSRMTKQEEQQALQHIISKMRSNGREGTEFKKIASRNKTSSYDITNTLGWRHLFSDERDYSYIAYDGTDMILTIRKRADGISYRIKLVEDFKKNPAYLGNFYPLYKDKEPEILKESDSDHGETLRQTGYWGKAGAGAIILSKRTGRILLPYRSGAVEQPHTWGVWGGAIDSDEDPSQAVRRELSEEVGIPLQIDELVSLFVYEDQRVGFRYSNFLAVVPEEFAPKLNWETDSYRWVSFGEWPSPLHFGLKLLLENSKDKIFQEIRKYAPETPVQKPKASMDKIKYNAAMHIIMLTWRDMTNAGDRSNRFDYENHFVHWMLNTQQIQDLLEKYGQQFYPGANEPGSEFQDDVEKVLEMLESKFNQRRAKKINSSDPLFLLKQMVRGKSWNGAKQALRKSSWSSQGWTNESMPDDMAESIFNRLYRHALGETFFDKDTIRNSKRLNQLILTSDTSVDERLFIQHYNGMKRDRFPDVVKVWRGLHSPSAKIKPGDFVTFDRGYARGYTTGKYGSVISDMIPSKDLFVIKPDTGSSELLYWPEGHQIQKVENVPSFKEFYNQWAFP